ncbi:MAG: NAD(P)H-hydrate epimerase, partial [Alphaproteobacteria bacterium RIFOXYD12_FULL_60_8]
MNHELLTVAQMRAADRTAPGRQLMDAAGAVVAREIRRRFGRCPVAVLCGPGNNGGDGFIIARRLTQAGWPVRLSLLGTPSGDAAWAASKWRGKVHALSPKSLEGCALVVDALFGAGLSRPIDGLAAEVITEMSRRQLPCVAVDVPSGVVGDTGQVLGIAPQADLTVTFFRRKPGHLLLPGRLHCG